jgi:hypothetical protein
MKEENAALAALGLLSARELAKTPGELVDEMREAASLLSETVPSVRPSPSLKNRLIERIAQFEALKPLADVRRYDDQWIHSGVPGVDTKTLFKDVKSGRTTMLIRMEPGASLPSHHHGDDEHSCTSHRPLLFCGRNTPARITSGTTIRGRDVTWDYRTGAARSGGMRTTGTTVVDLAVSSNLPMTR